MNKTVWIVLGGAAVVAVLLSGVLVGTKSNHLELTGNILKIRTLAPDPEGTIVVADFRISNPSGVPFVVENLEMTLERATGERVEGRVISKAQMDTVFQSLKLIGPKYNDILAIQDKVKPRETMDRMVAARFEVPEGVVASRKTIRVRIDEIDGTVAEITEAGSR